MHQRYRVIYPEPPGQTKTGNMVSTEEFGNSADAFEWFKKYVERGKTQHKKPVIARHPNQLEYFKWCHSNRYITTHIFKPSLGIQGAPKVNHKRMKVKNVRELSKTQQMDTTLAPEWD